MAMTLGIRGKIVLAGAALAAAGIAAVGGLLTHEASTGLTDQARQVLEHAAAQEPGHVNTEFARAITAARGFARTTLALRATKSCWSSTTMTVTSKTSSW